MLWLGRRFPFERRNWFRRAALHLMLGLCFAFTGLAISPAIFPIIGVLPTYSKNFGSSFALLLLIDFHTTVLTYWTVLGIQSGLRYYRGYQERKQQALGLELHASELKNQPLPHHCLYPGAPEP